VAHDFNTLILVVLANGEDDRLSLLPEKTAVRAHLEEMVAADVGWWPLRLDGSER